jgi:hypothetical protein
MMGIMKPACLWSCLALRERTQQGMDLLWREESEEIQAFKQ